MGETYPPPPPGAQPVYGPPTNGLAVAGMVLGIISIPLFFLNWIDMIIAIVGLVLSLVGLGKSNQLGGAGRGMAVAGIITSAVGIVAALVFLIAVVVSFESVTFG
jgi:hypothetical protein